MIDDSAHPLLTAGIDDHIFPIDGVRPLAEIARDAYGRAGAPDRFQSVLFPTGRSFPDEIKAEAYAFLDHWLVPGAITG